MYQYFFPLGDWTLFQGIAIPWYGYTKFCLSICHVMDIWVVVHFLVIMNDVAMNIQVQVLCGHRFPALNSLGCISRRPFIYIRICSSIVNMYYFYNLKSNMLP